ncbi:kinase-like domain-containing protein [Gigaspora rosea]|uniref:Kinase-like domain-containing protein n=1 Tax=Gigaspora rosea TaxID=44941 RepID=A0A397W3M8_9GLOM|nr:kinase-like domain-containing protein [Gigaspora rosea]
MQYAKQGSLRKILDSKYNELDWNSKIAILYYIIRGLSSIHKSGLVHKDFHSGNIVNQDMFRSFITDFGLCRPVSQDSNSKELFGVLPYVAPELLRASTYGDNIVYTQKSDIYSFGIIMSEVFTGYPPYHDINHGASLASRIIKGQRPEIKCEVPHLLLDLMKKCLDAVPDKRPTADELHAELYQLFYELKNAESEIKKQVQEIENSSKNTSMNNQIKSARINYQTHPQTSFISKPLQLPKLPKP